MKMLKVIKNLFGSSEKTSQQALVALEGVEARTKPLSTQHITYMFCKVKDLVSANFLVFFSEELNVSNDVVLEGIKKMTEDMNSALTCCVEYPYIDEFYRDTYYHFYSRKHGSHGRYCFRISFFKGEVEEDNFYDKACDETYLGYMVLRPTPRRVIGYSFLSPLVYLNNHFSICLCKRPSSIMGKILNVIGFPFCGQDGEMCSCAETTTVVALDYFSRKYNRYQRVLPSDVVNYNTDNAFQLLQPSKGIDVEGMVRFFNSMGLTTRRFQRQDEDSIIDNDTVFNNDDFIEFLHRYIESGFPLIVSEGDHVYLVIGRENKLFPSNPCLTTINDNQKPYGFLEDESQIKSFIVPQSDNILLDADQINVTKVLNDFQNVYKGIDFGVNDNDYYNRVFLTTSRSFKNYIVNSSIDRNDKDLIVCTAMPRFIWICESIKKSDVNDDMAKVKVSVTSVLDATEYAYGHSHLLLVYGAGKLIVPEEDKSRANHRIYVIYESKGTLVPFNNNLKGLHTSWQI